MIPPRRIVLSGGGIKLVSLVGGLKSLEEAGYLRKVKEVCGVSAGAWLAFIIATGYSIKKLEKLVFDLDFGIIRNLSPDAFIGFPETFGIDDGSKLVKFLESIMRVVLKLDPAITFAQMAELGLPGLLTFRCWATDLNTKTGREFSAKLTPTVKIIDALHASMCLPLYFTPVVDPITGHMLSDGGIQGNLPLHHLSDDECQESIALGFCYEDTYQQKKSAPDNLMEFVNAIFSCITHTRVNGSIDNPCSNEEVLKKWHHMILYVPVNHYPSWNFEASREDRIMLFTKGYESAKQWIANNKAGSRRTVRRYSIP